MCFREGDEWPQYLIPRSATQCASSLLLPSSHSFPWLQATSYMTCSWRLGKSPVHVSQREIFEFSPFALRSEEGDEDHKSYLPHESELSCPCSTLLLSSLGQAAGVQPQSMGIYERLVPGLATINIWQVSVCFYTFSVCSGGMARSTANGRSTVVLLQVFSTSLNNQLTLVGW